MADTNYDVIIIGSGPGGYVTAIRSAQLGLKTAIVEREHMGGICLNWGCIPTKALLRSAEIYHYMQHAKDYGLSAEKISFDPAAVVTRSRGVSGQLNGGIGFLMKKNKVDIIWGEGKISKAGEVTVSKTAKKAMEPQHPAPKGTKGEGVYKAKHIILATGARPRVIPGIEPDGKDIWTYFEAMVPPSMPKSLIVMGSGAIGIEFASFYKTMGADVTVIEMMPTIMPVEDPEISGMAKKMMEKAGSQIPDGGQGFRRQEGLRRRDRNGRDQGWQKKQDLTAEKMISAVGVVGNIENLGLEELGVKKPTGAAS
ncbi:FAD-dependent oxidoreductase [Roseibium salinum]|nr:FAD-dependent oxidoreductase [Roseibium salinum]